MNTNKNICCVQNWISINMFIYSSVVFPTPGAIDYVSGVPWLRTTFSIKFVQTLVHSATPAPTCLNSEFEILSALPPLIRQPAWMVLIGCLSYMSFGTPIVHYEASYPNPSCFRWWFFSGLSATFYSLIPPIHYLAGSTTCFFRILFP